MKHIVLLGDSIFDNKSYVNPSELDVPNQLRSLVGKGCKVTNLAVDGHVTRHIQTQLTHLPSDATCLLVMAGTTIGASVAINGKPFSGVSGFAGELGYFPIMQDCESTRLDKVAGGRYIISKLGVSPEEITSGILHGEQKYISAVNNAGQTLGRVISGVMSLINPSHVVVGGGTLRFPGYFESMQNEIERTCLNPILEVCSVTKASSGENVVANGALLAGKAKMIVDRKLLRHLRSATSIVPI